MNRNELLLKEMIRQILQRSASKRYKVLDNKVYVFEQDYVAGTREIVIVETEKYGNVAFYKRSGHGNDNRLNPEQAAILDWLPFGGLCTRLENLVKKDHKTKRLVTAGVDWFCKLPLEHPEGDGSGKFLKKGGEFYNICLYLTNNYSKLGLEKVSMNSLILEYFGMSNDALQEAYAKLEESYKKNNKIKIFPFRMPFLSQGLFGGIAINNKLIDNEALQLDWPPAGQYALTGTDKWGFRIKTECEFEFNGEIKKLKKFNGEILKGMLAKAK